MRATLIRHGKTVGNLEGRYIGCTDVPLCDAGRAEAAQARRDPALQTVYVSSLRRTQETAAILFPNAAQIVVDGFEEMDFGAFEGRTANEMAHDPAYRAWVDGFCQGPCPGGESQAGFRARVVRAFIAMLPNLAGDPVFVVHGGVIMAILAGLAEPKRDFYAWTAPNLGGFSFDVVKDRETVTLQNVTPVQL